MSYEQEQRMDERMVEYEMRHPHKIDEVYTEEDYLYWERKKRKIKETEGGITK